MTTKMDFLQNYHSREWPASSCRGKQIISADQEKIQCQFLLLFNIIVAHGTDVPDNNIPWRLYTSEVIYNNSAH